MLECCVRSGRGLSETLKRCRRVPLEEVDDLIDAEGVSA